MRIPPIFSINLVPSSYTGSLICKMCYCGLVGLVCFFVFLTLVVISDLLLFLVSVPNLRFDDVAQYSLKALREESLRLLLLSILAKKFNPQSFFFIAIFMGIYFGIYEIIYYLTAYAELEFHLMSLIGPPHSFGTFILLFANSIVTVFFHVMICAFYVYAIIFKKYYSIPIIVFIHMLNNYYPIGYILEIDTYKDMIFWGTLKKFITSFIIFSFLIMLNPLWLRKAIHYLLKGCSRN